MARDRSGSDGAPPVFGVYGVPQQWPHIRALYQRAGFRHTRHTDIVYLARVGDLPRPAAPPPPRRHSAAPAHDATNLRTDILRSPIAAFPLLATSA
jgi:hypothetical protein